MGHRPAEYKSNGSFLKRDGPDVCEHLLTNCRNINNKKWGVANVCELNSRNIEKRGLGGAGRTARGAFRNT